MELYVAEDFFGDFVADLTVERDEHRFGEGEGHKLLNHRIMSSDERYQVTGFGTETECHRKLQEEPYMEIAEISADGIQKQDILLAPFEKSLFRRPFPDNAVEHLAHKHRHRILEHIVPDPEKRMPGHKISGDIQV